METLFVGRNIIYLSETESTNSHAISLLKNVNTPEGTVVYSPDQRKGKGQRGSEWYSEKGKNLNASFMLKPNFLNAGEGYQLYQMAALACHDLLSQILNKSQHSIKIKWPNDLLVDEKKICGILIENIVQQARISWSVIGIGMNVNQEVFPLGLHATSILNTSGIQREINEILKLLSSRIEMYYLMIKNKKSGKLREMYLDKLYRLGELTDFYWNGKTETLMVKGVSEGGLLVLENKKGGKQEVDVKEIKWLNQKITK